MKELRKIKRFEHERLVLEKDVFEERHLNSLLKLNELHNFDYFDCIYNGIKFKQYVGIIQVDNLVIEIFPKADLDGDENTWRDVLLQMLKKCRRLHASTYGDANVRRQNLNLLEIYFSIFLSELEGLIQRGLIKKYRKQALNVNSLKGRILFCQHVSKNFVHQERFYTEHQVYDKDHTLHQILAAALHIVEQLSKGTLLYNDCKRVQLNFPEVSEVTITKKILDGFQFSRKFEPYRKAFEIARLLLLDYSPDISSGNEKMLALLFDMNKLWEEFIAVTLKEELENTKFQVTTKDRKKFWGENSLEPDLIISGENLQDLLIIDTKWKRPNNSSASIQDLRQMYAYNKFWNSSKAILLYPGTSDEQSFQNFLNPHEKPDTNRCKMAFINVVDKDGKLSCSIGKELLRQIELSVTTV